MLKQVVIKMFIPISRLVAVARLDAHPTGMGQSRVQSSRVATFFRGDLS